MEIYEESCLTATTYTVSSPALIDRGPTLTALESSQRHTDTELQLCDDGCVTM